MTDRVGDAARAPRSLTLHYVTPAEVGPVTVTTSIERVGRSLTSISAPLHQGDRLVALAMAAFSPPRPGPMFCDLEMPDVEDPDRIGPMSVHRRSGDRAPVGHALGDRGATVAGLGQRARPWRAGGSGWKSRRCSTRVRLRQSPDAWVPPVFSRLREQIVVPTIDLTVHFRVAPAAER